MKKTISNLCFKLLATAILMTNLTGCVGSNQDLADAVGDGAGTAASGIVCWLIGGCHNS